VIRRTPATGRFAPKIGAVLAVAALLAIATATPAYAHDGLVGSTPAAGEAVTAELTSVDLTFSDDFLQIGGYTPAFGIQITGPDGRFYNTDCVVLDGGTISTPAELGESGDYTVVWQVVSSDAHPISDTFGFSYAKPDSVAAAEGSPIGATCADDPAAAVNQEPVPAPVVTDTASPSTDEDTTSGESADAAAPGWTDTVLPIAFVVLLIGAVGSIIGLRIRRRGRDTH
jgi:methionine-rich copper-binding protein CopC